MRRLDSYPSTKPCEHCGATERYKNGQCAPCSRRHKRTSHFRHVESRGKTLRLWRNKNLVKTHARDNRRAAEKRRTYSAFLSKEKSKSCTDCGGYFHPHCMDFDHVRGKKLFNVGDGAKYSPEKIKAELAKCELVCANCHRLRTLHRKEPEWLRC